MSVSEGREQKRQYLSSHAKYVLGKYLFSVVFFPSPKQIQLKDLLRTSNVKSSDLKGGSLMELMKLKPPPNITTPVATATGTGPFFCLKIDGKIIKFLVCGLLSEGPVLKRHFCNPMKNSCYFYVI